MSIIARNSKSLLSKWWWTVDKQLLVAIGILLFIGLCLVGSASPAISVQRGDAPFLLFQKQIIFLIPAVFIMIVISMFNLRQIRRLSIWLFIFFLLMVVAIFFVGSEETKGASRWIRLFGFSLQPSEFIKPTFAVFTAWLLDGQKRSESFPGTIISLLFLALVVGLLFCQPDLGMIIIISAVWCAQLFLAGLRWRYVFLISGLLLVLVVGAYFVYDHVYYRLQTYFGGQEVSYQVKKSLASFANAGFWGKGLGEGRVKVHLPDAHTDFIFAVCGEELGIVVCLFVVATFAFIVLRAMAISMRDNSLFILLAASGISISFGLQAIINMGSTLRILPTKGMTLPLISYGGSSLLSCALGLGILLAVTRKNVYAEDEDYAK